jgi:hypothetical protein
MALGPRRHRAQSDIVAIQPGEKYLFENFGFALAASQALKICLERSCTA